ncbi:hypothetical protein DFH08DRAFT_1086012 [Mycena albidolilacea]|uniref:Uncharacterized protein n=1 Tax=Mycena albidolilacea TaxID=1033008 RepID=A0AAD6ZFQ5_9AGAR|nr:hypothetical protein DFH08DRAFT_1086012 [Mycena albidolilacea]
MELSTLSEQSQLIRVEDRHVLDIPSEFRHELRIFTWTPLLLTILMNAPSPFGTLFDPGVVSPSATAFPSLPVPVAAPPPPRCLIALSPPVGVPLPRPSAAWKTGWIDSSTTSATPTTFSVRHAAHLLFLAVRLRLATRQAFPDHDHQELGKPSGLVLFFRVLHHGLRPLSHDLLPLSVLQMFRVPHRHDLYHAVLCPRPPTLFNGPTSSEATVIGAVFDGIEDTNPWTDSVSLSLLTFPTPDAELNLSHLFAMVDVVWMGDAKRLEMSGSAETLDNSAAERLEMSASCIDNSAAKLEHLEMSLSFEVLENPVAMHLEMSGPGSGTVDNSAACDLRLGGLLTDDIMPLAAGPAPTLVVSNKVADTANGSDGRVVQILVDRVDVDQVQ